MVNKIHALLVGIDHYASDAVSTLNGCASDVEAMEQLLIDRFGASSASICKLINGQATHSAIKKAFAEALLEPSRAPDKESAAFVFHFSGHGSQAIDPTGLKPSGLDESIVPHDSRRGGIFDIKDWELGQMLSELAAHTQNVTVILDCCHSGSGTRSDDSGSEKSQTRHCPLDDRPQPSGDPEAAPSRDFDRKVPYVVLAACRDDQKAHEHTIGEADQVRHYGALTYGLIQELGKMTRERPLTYRELHERVCLRVQALHKTQTPQCEGDLDRLVLEGARASQDRFLTIVEQVDGLHWIDGGLAHGLTVGSLLHAFPPDTRQVTENEEPLATLIVREVGATRSAAVGTTPEIEIPVLARLIIHRLNDPWARRRVVVDVPEGSGPQAARSWPPPLSRSLVMDRLESEDVRQHVEADTKGSGHFRIQSVEGQLELQDAAGDTLVEPYTPGDIEQLAQDLKHIVRYQRALELSSAEPSLDGLLELVVETESLPVFHLANHSDHSLYFALFLFREDWSIKQVYPLSTGAHERLAPGKTFSSSEGLAKEGWRCLKAIATAKETRFEFLQQGPLRTPFIARSSGASSSGLSQLLAQTMTGRATLGECEEEPGSAEVWTTAQVEA